MGLDTRTRHLYALTNIDGNLILVTLLLYAVIAVCGSMCCGAVPPHHHRRLWTHGLSSVCDLRGTIA